MTVAFMYRDCGCSAHWSGDELTVKPCPEHAAEWTPDLRDALAFAGPPTFIESRRFPEIHHGHN